MNSSLFSFISACTALIATIIGPYVALKTAKSQINASVISTNRARWIETLRDLIASMISQLTAYMILKATLHDTQPDNIATHPQLLRRIERGMRTISKIRLMMNPNESDNQKLIETLDFAMDCLRSRNDHSHVEHQIRVYTTEIVRLSQAILKREWIRVKQGT